MNKLKVILAILVVCHGLKAQEQPVAYHQVSQLTISLDRFDLHITRAPGADLILGSSDITEAMLEIVQRDGTLDIRQITETGMFSRTPRLNLQVPENLVFQIKANEGDLIFDQITGVFQVSTHEGDISATISPTGPSSFDSESGKVNVKLAASLKASMFVSAGSGQGTVNFSGHPVNARITMKSFYPSGKIKAPFEFKEVHITHTYGPDTIVKSIVLGERMQEVNLSTGGGTISIIQ